MKYNQHMISHDSKSRSFSSQIKSTYFYLILTSSAESFAHCYDEKIFTDDYCYVS